jgi:ankyrin repeat protein
MGNSATKGAKQMTQERQNMIKQNMTPEQIAEYFNKQDGNGNTPVMQAIKSDDTFGLRKLLKYKTDPRAEYGYNIDFTTPDNEGLTPIVVAAQQIKDNLTNGFIVELCDAGVDINSTDLEGNTPFMIVTMGKMDKVYDFDMNEPLHTMVYNTLLKYGANINQGNNKGTTPLLKAIEHWANFKNYGSPFEFVKFLVENGADVNQADNEGTTPLIAAVKYGKEGNSKDKFDEQMIKYLISKGAYIDIADKNGNTPQIWANNMKRDNYQILDTNSNYNNKYKSTFNKSTGGKRKSIKKRKTNKKKKSNKRRK